MSSQVELLFSALDLSVNGMERANRGYMMGIETYPNPPDQELQPGTNNFMYKRVHSGEQSQVIITIFIYGAPEEWREIFIQVQDRKTGRIHRSVKLLEQGVQGEFTVFVAAINMLPATQPLKFIAVTQ